MANIKIGELQINTFEELSDADLVTVVGGQAADLVVGLGREVGDISQLAGEELFGESGVLDLYDFLFRPGS
ncbi:hypothetical protein BLD44_006505 [Mastigocladus laminosus UU774]|nr:MAG: hypothetical protein C6Y22_22455 [Hapalosiphonaceae cyanobacterium JJU2]TBR57445.1 hypothetical protein B4U84_15700 [Westiellopsis prolifica IICB1]TFI55000.1 hypothetical protein BLD44_006505 [Mastigocladus laminosus UU774]